MDKVFPVIMYAAYISIICIAVITVMNKVEKKKFIILPIYVLVVLLIAFYFDGNEKLHIGTYAVNFPVLLILNIDLIIKEKKYITNEWIGSIVSILCIAGYIQYYIYGNINDVLIGYALAGMIFVLNIITCGVIELFLSNQYMQKNIICILINSLCYSLTIYYIPNADWINQYNEYLKIAVSVEMIGLFLLIYNCKHIMLNMNDTIEQLKYVYKYNELEHIEKMYDEAKKIRHNMKQNIIVAEGFIDSKQYQKAKEYMDELLETKAETFGYIRYCDNQVINYIINSKRDRCIQKKIEFKCIVFGKITGVNDIDISVLIGNLLDNAIEAAELTNDKIVNLEIYDRNYVEVIIENSIKKSVLQYNPAFLTTKGNNELHGYGMKSIKEIISKYRGEITYEESYNLMSCRAILLKS